MGRMQKKQLETLDEIREHARGEGFDVSNSQLERYRAHGLLPRFVTRKGLGRGSGGSVVYYPEGTGEQLVAILRALEIRRSFDAVGWYLWNQGFPVTGFVREKLLEGLRQLEEDLRETLQRVEDPHADDPLLELQQADRLPAGGWIRRRVGADRFPSVVYVALRIGLGEAAEITLDDELYPVLYDAYEAIIDKLLPETLVARLRDPTREEIRDILEGLSEMWSVPGLRGMVENASEEDLRSWLEEARKVHELLDPEDAEESQAVPLRVFIDVLITEQANWPLATVLEFSKEEELLSPMVELSRMGTIEERLPLHGELKK
jgi:hypothetical protein